MIATAHDGHANLWNSDVQPPIGECQLPVKVRFVNHLPVVTGFSSAVSNDPSKIKIGDILMQLDGTGVTELVQSWAPYYSASNDAARLEHIGRTMTRGECGDLSVIVRRGNWQLKLEVKRTPGSDDSSAQRHDLPGPTFRLLSKDVAYLKLSSVKAADAVHYIEQATGTKGLIIDIRNYPSQFVVFALGRHLVENATDFVRFTEGDLSNPGAFHWLKPISLSPEKPYYSGKVVILVDETSMSQAEYTAMAFQVAPGATVVGSAPRRVPMATLVHPSCPAV